MVMTVIGHAFPGQRRSWLMGSLALWVLSIWFPSSAWAMTGPWVDRVADVLAIMLFVLIPIGGS